LRSLKRSIRRHHVPLIGKNRIYEGTSVLVSRARLRSNFSERIHETGRRPLSECTKRATTKKRNPMALINDIIPWRGSRRELARRDDPFNYLRSQINRVFDDAFSGGNWPAETAATFTPQLEVTETDKEVKICAELPGIESEEHTSLGVKHGENSRDAIIILLICAHRLTAFYRTLWGVATGGQKGRPRSRHEGR